MNVRLNKLYLDYLLINMTHLPFLTPTNNSLTTNLVDYPVTKVGKVNSLKNPRKVHW